MKNLNIYRLLICLRYPQLRSLFSIPTHLTDRERFTLFKLSKSYSQHSRSVLAVEIGSYLGSSTSFLAAGLRNGDSIFCIDTWGNDAMSEGPRDTFETFLANTEPYRERVTPMRGWSHDPSVLEQVKARAKKVDLLFIDGDHSYEGALSDWRLYAPLLAPGATVAMHDIGWADGVRRVVDEEIRPHVVSEGSLANLWWGQLPL